MSRPEDIPQDVWDKAKDIVFTPYLMEWEGIAAVAYAILAAKAEERRECLAEVEKEIEYTRKRMSDGDDSHRMLVSQAWGMCSDTAGVIAERIRRREG